MDLKDIDITFDFQTDTREGKDPDSDSKTLRLLTHSEDLTYEEYVKRIATSGNDIAIHVKYNDLCHNLKRGRAGGHTKQVQKHEKALSIIKVVL